jgi:hypothetical protein
VQEIRKMGEVLAMSRICVSPKIPSIKEALPLLKYSKIIESLKQNSNDIHAIELTANLAQLELAVTMLLLGW